MPKSQYVDPAKAFEAGYIHFNDIPVCQYNKTLAEEKKIYTKDDFIRIYRDMAIIREFETMLNDVKTTMTGQADVSIMMMTQKGSASANMTIRISRIVTIQTFFVTETVTSSSLI